MKKIQINAHSNFKILEKRVSFKDKKEALDIIFASNNHLKELAYRLPYKGENQIDLVPVSFEACNVNMFNKKGHGISSLSAKQIAKDFIYKPINIEHKRKNVIGVITGRFFSHFDKDNRGWQIWEEDDILNSIEPYNISLSGFVWPIVDESIVEYIESASNENSENYLAVNASWEMSFKNYSVALLPEGSNLLKDAEEVISKGARKSEALKHLISNGGTGVFEGRKVCILVEGNNDCHSLGVGFTSNPAGYVDGVATEMTFASKEDLNDVYTSSENSNEESASENEVSKDNPEVLKIDTQNQNIGIILKESGQISHITPENTNKISINANNIVITDKQNLKEKIMKIKSLKDITDENLKEITASTVVDFIKEHVQENIGQWEAKYQEVQKAKTDKEGELATIKANNEKLANENKEFAEKLEAIAQEIKAKKDQDLFNDRMTAIDEAFDIGDAERVILKDQVKILGENEFDGFFSNLKVLMASKIKQVKAEAKELQDGKQIVASAVESATPKAGIPNAQNVNETDLKSKYAKSFSMEDGFVFVK